MLLLLLHQDKEEEEEEEEEEENKEEETWEPEPEQRSDGASSSSSSVLVLVATGSLGHVAVARNRWGGCWRQGGRNIITGGSSTGGSKILKNHFSIDRSKRETEE